MSDHDSLGQTGSGPEEERTATVVPPGGPWPVPAALAPEPLERGALVGRYVIVGTVGEGGMGVVYAGYDPELDRKVALKVLRPERAASASARARMLREAQAIARLSHPNVVAVHDAGTFGEQVFLAMEYVEGQTLRGWLRDPGRHPRSWREIVDVFILAGKGLAAAHAAGLVHRDFKPDNVLLGKDGRVRVADFGLARPVDLEEDEEPGVSRSSGSGSPAITEWGVLMGTPRYMAPEQLRGRAADARSDQFSFCVALYEALYGERPFPGEGTEEIAGAAERGEIRPAGEGTRVPAWLRQILLRGLSGAPAARYPSMDDLLRDLAKDPGVARRRWLAAALVLVIGGGLLAWGTFLGGAGRVCRGAADKLAGVWDAGRKEAARAAFLATGKPHAEGTWSRVERALDTYTGDWAAMRQEACEATRVRGEQSEDLLDRRMFCLDQRLREVGAVAGLFSRADATVVVESLTTVGKLPRLSSCADVQALTARLPPPRDPALRARVDQVRAAVAETRVWSGAEGEERAAKAVAAARRTGYKPVEAEALYQLGFIQVEQGQFDKAGATLFEALVAAQSSGDLETAARSASQLSYATGESSPTDAKRWSQLSWAIGDALPRNDALRSELLRHRASILSGDGRFAEAVEVSLRAIPVTERAYGRESPQMAAILSNLGIYYNEMGRNEESIRASLQGLAIRRKILSPGHPDFAKSYNTLGNAYSDLNRFEEALANFRQSLAILVSSYGPDHPNAPGTRANIAIAYKDLGRYEEAERMYQEALKDFVRILGPDHIYTALVLANLGEIHGILKRHTEALEDYRRALAINEKVLGPEHPDLAFALGGQGVVLLDMGRAAEAVPLLERALAVREKRDIDPDLVSEMRFILAQALWQIGERERALRLARLARDGYAANDSEELRKREVEEWLSSRKSS